MICLIARRKKRTRQALVGLQKFDLMNRPRKKNGTYLQTKILQRFVYSNKIHIRLDALEGTVFYSRYKKK